MSARKTKAKKPTTRRESDDWRDDYRRVEAGQIRRLLDRIDGQLVQALRAHQNREGAWTDVPHLGDVLGEIAIDTKIIRRALATSDALGKDGGS